MDPYDNDWLNKFYNLNMAAVIDIASRRDLRIETHRGNQANETKLYSTL